MVKLELLSYSYATCQNGETSFISALQDAKGTSSRKKYMDQKLRAAASCDRMLLRIRA